MFQVKHVREGTNLTFRWSVHSNLRLSVRKRPKKGFNRHLQLVHQYLYAFPLLFFSCYKAASFIADSATATPRLSSLAQQPYSGPARMQIWVENLDGLWIYSRFISKPTNESGQGTKLLPPRQNGSPGSTSTLQSMILFVFFRQNFRQNSMQLNRD